MAEHTEEDVGDPFSLEPVGVMNAPETPYDERVDGAAMMDVGSMWQCSLFNFHRTKHEVQNVPVATTDDWNGEVCAFV